MGNQKNTTELNKVEGQKVYAPLKGKIIAIEHVADDVFAQKMIGDGLAIRPLNLPNPSENSPVFTQILSPWDGIVQTIHASKHAVTLTTTTGNDLLIHVGINTVKLRGEGFQQIIKEGAHVKKGDPLLSVDFNFISKNATSIDVIVLATNLGSKQKLHKTNKTDVGVLQEILEIQGLIEGSKGYAIDKNSRSWFGKIIGMFKGSKDHEHDQSKNQNNIKIQNHNSLSTSKIADNKIDFSEAARVESDLIAVPNHLGIHARPASAIFNLANTYKAKIELKKGEKAVNAKSIVAILGLSVKHQEQVKVIATGEDAHQAVEAIVKAIKSGLGEEIPGAAESGKNFIDNTSKNTVSKNAALDLNNQSTSKVDSINSSQHSTKDNIIIDFSKEVTLPGVSASPGMANGRVFLFIEEEPVIEEKGKDPASEAKILSELLAKAKAKLQQDIEKAKSLNLLTQIEIFEAHRSLIEDEELIEGAKNHINEGKSAGYAWTLAIKSSIEILRSTNDKLLIERVADLKDLKRRVINELIGKEDTISAFPEDTIIVAKDLVPSDLSNFEVNVKGVMLALGSKTSHVALMLRNMGLPVLVNLGNSILNIKNTTLVILDANNCFTTINPDESKIKENLQAQEKLGVINKRNMENAKKPAITKDNTTITVKGNVSNITETNKAFNLGAEGVGLLRTEFLFFNSRTAPSEDTQVELYQKAVDAMEGHTVTFRTLDVGGDKPLAFIKIDPEENPIMGLRGVRNYMTNLDIFLSQIRAILRIKPLMLSKIMIPMVADISEIIEIKKVIEDEKAKLGIKDKIEIGTMIEVPSAALISDSLAKYVDFFSIGTNDLAQYTLAMDRGNSNLSAKLQNLHPALLKLIAITVQSGRKSNIPTAICGAMASELVSIPILIGLGVKELSVSMKSIPEVKALIRDLNYAKCKEIADKALVLETADQVIALVRKEFNL